MEISRIVKQGQPGKFLFDVFLTEAPADREHVVTVTGQKIYPFRAFQKETLAQAGVLFLPNTLTDKPEDIAEWWNGQLRTHGL